MAENYKHFFLTDSPSSEKYKSPSSGGSEEKIPDRNRMSHSNRLTRKFDEIWDKRKKLKEEREAEQIPTRSGTYLSFSGAANADLITKSLEDLRKGIRLLNVQEISTSKKEKQTRAIVYVPKGKEAHFIDKIQKYQTENLISGKPKNEKLVNSIDDIEIALLESFWLSKPELFPEDDPKWLEVWLNVNSKENKEKDQIATFRNTLEDIGIEAKPNHLIFPERAVLLVNANRSQLVELMMRSDLLAELRIGQEPAGFWVNESRLGQQKWVNDLLKRAQLEDTNVKVCLLDSGVNNGHPLLEIIIDNDNTLTVDPTWGSDDHKSGSGHGTLMAGVSGYGNLEKLLLSDEHFTLTHRLCSVKILPRDNQEQTPKELWGDITSRGISISEIENPDDNMVFCLSLTSKEDSNEGRPSSWSGAIDNITYGRNGNQRLVIVSAGNIDDAEDWKNYPDSNYLTTIQNPAQSWNALTVGAYTKKVEVKDPDYKDHTSLAQKGELSPFSSTSNVWENKWPIKPDVVFEGGNLLKSPENEIARNEDLESLSTSKATIIRYFDTINATSGATAQASWFAAKIAHVYPDAWPETIRGLLVHSARWNDAMLHQKGTEEGKKSTYCGLIRTFGFGIPNLERALYSQESAFTLIAQETIQPFGYKEGSKSQVETNEMHFYELPWPKDLLLELSETEVTLRITLSYFIEPGPGEIGWKDKYRYASHGLRFNLINVGEPVEDFQKRVNAEAREKEESFSANSGSDRWTLGSRNRQTGSIHSDLWKGTASELADCNQIAVSPIIGWWRERKHLGRVNSQTRYSLIISLETPAEDVELYTTVKAKLKVPIETTIRTE